MDSRQMTSEEGEKIHSPQLSQAERRAFIEHSDSLEGQYLDDEEREIMESYNGRPELPQPLREQAIDALVKHDQGRAEDSKRT